VSHARRILHTLLLPPHACRPHFLALDTGFGKRAMQALLGFGSQCCTRSTSEATSSSLHILLLLLPPLLLLHGTIT
jgi:hypothetical protein